MMECCRRALLAICRMSLEDVKSPASVTNLTDVFKARLALVDTDNDAIEALS